ncbi:MAG: OmpA family protein [Gemmatimonadota bacterium]|nr:OmpA family protein [Gemmatimonadota bacterium]
MPPKGGAGGRKIIIVKKKIVGGGGHHGGSWKVAYADFVTAMMAFFMVMWILGMDDKTKKAVEGYFSNPVGVKKGFGSGSSPLFIGSSPTTIQRPSLKMVMHASEKRTFEQMRERILQKLAANDSLKSLKALVDVQVTTEGLRIELIESGQGDHYFALGSAQMKPATALALRVVGAELALLSHKIILEGHTDAAKFGAVSTYSNWELSTERALAARRVLADIGVGDGRLAEIRGLADTQLRVPADPAAAANRRISILLPFTTDKLLDAAAAADSAMRDSIAAGAAGRKPTPSVPPARN